MSTSLSPPQIAKMLGVYVDTPRTWIRTGQLRAVDVSTKPGGRPRYRVSSDDLDVFLLRRSIHAAPKTQRRRRQATDVTEYF